MAIDNSFLDWVRGRGKIVLVVHDNPDPDCLASALALRHLLMVKLCRDAIISFSGIIGRSENLAMVRTLEIPLVPLSRLDLAEFQVVCMLDTQPGTGNNSLPANTRVDLVIDHHPLRDATKVCRWLDVREDYGATATILYEYLLSFGVSISTRLATALFYAIKSETQDLGREAGYPDREAYVRLFPLANKKLLYDITYPKLPVEYFTAVQSALERSRIYGSALITRLGSVAFPEIVAEMADFLLRLEGIDTVLSIGYHGATMIISLRTSRHERNAGLLIRKIVSGRGTAGGHGMMAAGRIDSMPADESVRSAVEDTLVRGLLDELGIGSERPRLFQGLCR